MSLGLRPQFTRLLGTVLCAAAVGSLLPTTAHAVVEPLQDYLPVSSTKVSEDIDENWSFSTRTPYWSVLAVQPPSGWDTYTDVGFDGTGFVRGAPNGITGVNFVAIDSNAGRRPFGQYFGRAIPNTPPPGWPGGAPRYTVMLAQGADVIGPGSTSITWGGGRFVTVRDVYLTAGQQATVTVNPADIAYLFASDPTNSSTWVQARDLASTRTDGGRMRYAAVRAGWHGLVLVNRRGVSTSTVRITVS
jgi:hypothetical protein